MTEYVHVIVDHIGNGKWGAYSAEYGLFIEATSKPKLEYETYRQLEEAIGLKSFVITWREV